MGWKFGQALNIGKRSEQQDRLALFHSKNGKRHLMVVADGMGGLENGAQAAQIVIDTAENHFYKKSFSSPELLLQDIITQAHEQINALEIKSAVPGTTCVILYIDINMAYWAHIGDSRLYHFRNWQLLNRTVDHSAMQLMIDKGIYEENSEEANAMQNQLYKRLGGELFPEPDFNSCTLESGDMFLLCSDGLWQAISHDKILEVLEEHPLDQDGPEQLIDIAIKNSGTNCDNISVLISQIIGTPKKSTFSKYVMTFSVISLIAIIVAILLPSDVNAEDEKLAGSQLYFSANKMPKSVT